MANDPEPSIPNPKDRVFHGRLRLRPDPPRAQPTINSSAGPADQVFVGRLRLLASETELRERHGLLLAQERERARRYRRDRHLRIARFAIGGACIGGFGGILQTGAGRSWRFLLSSAASGGIGAGMIAGWNLATLRAILVFAVPLICLGLFNSGASGFIISIWVYAALVGAGVLMSHLADEPPMAR